MKKIKIVIVLLLVICGGNQIMAQSDHLEPPSGVFDGTDVQFEYYAKIRKVLFQGLNSRPVIRFLVIPSFTAESVLDIEFDRTTQKLILVYLVCDKNLWYNKNGEQVNVIRKSKEISNESVELIKSLFEVAIQGVQYPAEPIIGCDGEKYLFSINKFGFKSGMTWSPNKDTKMRRLVDIGMELTKLAISDKAIVHFDDKLKANIIQLKNDLK
jgi:hypothetical protein